MELLDWRFDDTTLRADGHVRRVTLKAPVSRFRLFRPLPSLLPHRSQETAHRQAQKGEPTPRSRGQALSRPAPGKKAEKEDQAFRDQASPAIFIQCAYDTTQRDTRLAEIRAQFNGDVADLETESADTLARLRDRLMWISLGTFAATLAGGFWLVRLGLSPLHRLSDAVGRVSEKNFRLEFDGPGLPQELRPIVERLTQTLELLKRAFAREKQAAADISHELRTPLAALLTTTEVALRKPRAPEEYRELLEECRSSSQQISQLVERLLALARLDAGADTLRPQEVDAVALAEQCAALVRPLAEARGLNLHIHGQGPVRLLADPDKLREVFTNLLHNAIEYNRPQGSVDLAVERDNGSLRIQVRDTGIGIAPAARQQIFERFFRADPSRQADGLHAGLGLAIVKGYVELMGGTIAVDSKEGQGSTFSVQLPV
jgi:heavy metal sensor kinase